MRARIRTTWRALTRRVRWEKDLDEELRLHVELRAEDLRRADWRRWKPNGGRAWNWAAGKTTRRSAAGLSGLAWFDEARQDLQYAARILRRSPLFTAGLRPWA